MRDLMYLAGSVLFLTITIGPPLWTIITGRVPERCGWAGRKRGHRDASN